MDKGLLPRRYAKALYKYAEEKGQTAKIYELMQRLDSAFAGNHDLQTAIANPYIAEKQKEELITTAIGEENSVIADFIRLLAKNNRLDIIRGTALAYVEIYRKQNNIHPVTITSASPLSETDKKRITDMIEKHIGEAKAEYNFEVDSKLIGGFVVRIDNESLDASISNELKQLRRNLIK